VSALFAEFLGTAILILLGNGVVANVLLEKTKGHGGGWIVISAGWGFAVFVAAASVGRFSDAHLNPAVTIGLALADKFEWSLAPGYITAQMLGALIGAALVHEVYKDHYDATADRDAKLATFCTAPAIRNLPRSFFCETVGTFVLVFAGLFFAAPSFPLDHASGTQTIKVGLGSIGAIQVGLLVFAIGLSLGGTTGYAINPARLSHFGPREIKRPDRWDRALRSSEIEVRVTAHRQACSWP
jgi:glycerol uptake facilitator protein